MHQTTTHQTTQFSIGDVVTLKTGGPRMTVSYVLSVDRAAGERLFCQWFDEQGEFRQEVFTRDMVTLEPRSITPGSVHLRTQMNEVDSSV